MHPQRNQPQNSVAKKPALKSPVFKTGDYVPLSVLLFKDGREQNYILPHKLFAIKEFQQRDVLFEYHFQHPQQPVMLDPHRPNIGAFNSAVMNFHQWLIKKGYCFQAPLKSDLKIHVWTQEEIVAARALEAAHAQEIAPELIQLAAQTAGVDPSMIALEPTVNVGTVGHVDHGHSPLAQSVSDSSLPFTDVEGGKE